MSENVVINKTQYNGVDALALVRADGSVATYFPDAVRYNPQTLTDEQTAHARTNIGAASAETVSKLSKDIGNLLPKNQGSENAGKILVVGSDGNLTLADMPEPGLSGDVVGTLDESNNILLSGDIAEGTYPLKWLLADGTYADAGTLTVTLTPAPEAIINWITHSINADGTPFVGTDGEKGYKTGYRLSASSGEEKVLDGYSVSGFIPVKYNDALYIKDIGLDNENNTNMAIYELDADSGAPKHLSTAVLYTAFVEKGQSISDGVYTTVLDGNVSNYARQAAFIRISSKSITENSVLTVNQPIE